jgi:isopentenyldiphosphate isomerase
MRPAASQNIQWQQVFTDRTTCNTHEDTGLHRPFSELLFGFALLLWRERLSVRRWLPTTPKKWEYSHANTPHETAISGTVFSQRC